jgi:uncharacterized protein YjbI with pentapeptide repeats
MNKRSIPTFEEELQNGTLNHLSEGYRFDNLQFANETCTRDLSELEFHECQFDHVVFSSACKGTLYADAIFDHCEFSNMDFEESVFRRAQFNHCRLTGVDLSRSVFQDVEFRECEGRYASFSGSTFKQVLFERCVLAQTGFSSCKFTNTELHDNDFTEAEFVDTRLAGLDFSDSLFQGIMVSPEDPKGVTLNSDQAIMCVQLLGIRVK